MNSELARAPILIVDDDADARAIFGAALTHGGYNVLLTPFASQALPIAAMHKPALIILDLHLPDGDGFETAERLCADERTVGIPIFAISAAVGADVRERALSAGCARFIAKPLTPRDLLALVNAELGSPAKSDES